MATALGDDQRAASVLGRRVRILAVDGGGVRGAFAAGILALIESRIGVNLRDHFDLIAGTSTGSIIAAGIATGKKAADLKQLYHSDGHLIFDRSMSRRIGSSIHLQSKYSSEALNRALVMHLPDMTMGEISKPLIIPATDISTGGVHVFKSGYSSSFTRDRDVRLRDAVLASCAAPVFFDPHSVGAYRLADGGMWANNPSLVALLDALRFFNASLAQIDLLSIGTGRATARYEFHPPSVLERLRNGMFGWGFLGRWRGKKMIELMMNLQADAMGNMLRLLLDSAQPSTSRYLRLSFETDQELPLDEAKSVDDLFVRADKLVAYQSARLQEFFS